MGKPTLTFVMEEAGWVYNLEANLNAAQAAGLMANVAEFLSQFAVEFREFVQGCEHEPPS